MYSKLAEIRFTSEKIAWPEALLNVRTLLVGVRLGIFSMNKTIYQRKAPSSSSVFYIEARMLYKVPVQETIHLSATLL